MADSATGAAETNSFLVKSDPDMALPHLFKHAANAKENPAASGLFDAAQRYRHRVSGSR
jgi:hypothetical protein